MKKLHLVGPPASINRQMAKINGEAENEEGPKIQTIVVA